MRSSKVKDDVIVVIVVIVAVTATFYAILSS
jgi:hypothetical protein